MSSSFRNNRSGFTLLEILISIAILMFISLGIYQATTETYHLRDVLSVEGEFYNGIRLAMSIVQRDVALIYSPVLMLPPKPKQDPNAPQPPADPRMQQYAQSANLGQTTQFWEPAVDATGIRPSRFVGSDNKLSFIAVSHLRIYKNSPESEFAKVTYEVQPDKDNPDNPDGMVLVKTESPNAFDLDDGNQDKYRRSYPLLHGIKKFSIKYYQRDGDTWKTSNAWDSDKEDTKNVYPDIVEVSIEVTGPQNLSFEGTYKLRPEVPLHGIDPTI